MLAHLLKFFSAPKWRAGDWVEVRSREEILSTLDARASIDALPFMPEMLPHCGKRFQILKAAHKTCDPTGRTNLRRMKDTVHLETRCDGSAHDGCQAGCLFFWKEDWLKPAGQAATPPRATGAGCTVETLHRETRVRELAANEAVQYRCQTVEIPKASTPLSSLEPTQYLRDLASRNITLTEFAWYVPLSILKNLYVFLRDNVIAGSKQALAKLRGIELPKDMRKSAPSAGLNLQPGETVQILSKDEILATLGKERKNLGLSFDADMAQYCGETRKVLKRVERLIDERTGKMLVMSRDCLILDGVICKGLDCRSRLFCTRGAFTFWREAWVKRTAS